MGTLEGWPDILYRSIDGDYDTEGPSVNNNYIISLFYISFILVGGLFFTNLFVGAICYHFDKCHKNEKCAMHSLLTDEQIKWIELQKMIIHA